MHNPPDALRRAGHGYGATVQSLVRHAPRNLAPQDDQVGLVAADRAETRASASATMSAGDAATRETDERQTAQQLPSTWVINRLEWP